MYSAVEPKKRSKRIYVFIIIAVILLLGIVFGYMIYEKANIGSGPVSIEVVTDKPFYLQGEEVKLLIYVDNQQNWRVEYPSLIHYQIADLDISLNRDYGDFVPSFPAHSRILYDTYTWNQKFLNRTLVQPGNYTFTVSFDANSASCTFEVRLNPNISSIPP